MSMFIVLFFAIYVKEMIEQFWVVKTIEIFLE